MSRNAIILLPGSKGPKPEEPPVVQIRETDGTWHTIHQDHS